MRVVARCVCDPGHTEYIFTRCRRPAKAGLSPASDRARANVNATLEYVKVGINRTTASTEIAPFGGMKEERRRPHHLKLLGLEYGIVGIKEGIITTEIAPFRS